jgi:stage II sporulation protein AA (anti-sigma F factor antagonist)
MGEGTDDRRHSGRPASPPAFAVPGFELEDELLDDGTCVLTVRGELDLATGPVLGQRIRRPLFWSDVRRLVVDLSGVTFIDSSGTSALVLSDAHARSLERDVLFVCPDGSALRRIRSYGLELRLSLYGSREEALSA